VFTKLGSALGFDIKQPADIVQGAEWLAEKRSALEG
jgi:hypothetical protein